MLCEVGPPGLFLIASSLLQDQNSEAEHCSRVCGEKVERERRSKEGDEIVFVLRALVFYTNSFYSSFFFLSDSCAFTRRPGDKKVKRVNHAFSAHTCAAENKSLSIRVFSLTRGLGTICGLLLSHRENLRQTSTIKNLKLLTQVLLRKPSENCFFFNTIMISVSKNVRTVNTHSAILYALCSCGHLSECET